MVEKLVTIAREDTLAQRRKALAYLFDEAAVHKLFVDIGPRCRDRRGGYTRVTRTRVRAGDAAELAVIEFVDAPGSGGISKSEGGTNGKKKGAKSAPKSRTKTASAAAA